MKLAQLIAIAAIATILAQTNVLAQETPASIAPTTEKSAESSATPANPVSIAPTTEKSAESSATPANPVSIAPATEKSTESAPTPANPAATICRVSAPPPAPITLVRTKEDSCGINFGINVNFGF
jgi:hypothetical protein